MSSQKKQIDAIIGVLEPRKVYPVTQDELNMLRNSSSDSLHLNFAIFCLASALSATLAILTISGVLSTFALTFIWVVLICGYCMGAFFLLNWRKNRKNKNEILNRIQARINENLQLQNLLDQSITPPSTREQVN